MFLEKGFWNAKNGFLQMSQLHHYKAHHNPWCHFIFGYVG
jgi:hypothetical protein